MRIKAAIDERKMNGVYGQFFRVVGYSISTSCKIHNRVNQALKIMLSHEYIVIPGSYFHHIAGNMVLPV